MNIKNMIYETYPKFTKTEMKIADFIMTDPDISNLSLSDLALQLQVGEASILRFCRKLKFYGFQDFKFTYVLERTNK